MSVSIGSALICCILFGGVEAGAAVAAEAGTNTTAQVTRFATVFRVQGEVTATSGEATPARTLHEGDPVFVGERIRAAASAEAVLKTEDTGFIAVRPRVQFVVEQYAADGRSTDVFALRVIEGGLRLISGWISRTNRAQYRVATPNATIGIRGTDHEPYVMSADLAKTFSQTEGVYDKVNRGGTTMDVSGRSLDIDSGQVGFVRARPLVTRGLLTLLMPVILDKIPDFYVPGQFDGELDRLSQTSDEDALRALEARRRALPAETPAQTPVPAEPVIPAPPVKPAAKPASPAVRDCGADKVAKAWLSEFDSAVERRDAATIVRKFAPDVLIRATVRGAGDVPATIEMGRDEFVKSTTAATEGLTEFQQQRVSMEARPGDGGVGMCSRISIRSVVIERGRQNGKPYRFESVEEYLLERRSGTWLAIRAQTTQR